MPKGSRAKIGIIILSLIVLATVSPIFTTGKGQHDFKVLYAAASAAKQGLDPYDTTHLSQAIGETVSLPFVYTPSTLITLRPLTLFDLRTAGILFLILKLIALVALVYILLKIFPFAEYRTLFLVLLVFAFNGALFADLKAGNISLFEQVLIWLGFYYYLQDKPGYFATLILLAASFKLTPVLLLALLFLRFHKKELRIAFTAALAFFFFLACNALIVPDHFSSFLASTETLNASGVAGERGVFNPSSLQLMYDVIRWIERTAKTTVSDIYAIVLYATIICTLLFFSLRGFLAIRKERARHADLLRICLVCFTYALIVPRFKNYSYLLLIAPAFYVILSYAKHNSLVPLASILLVIFSSKDFGMFGHLYAPFYRAQSEYYDLLLAVVLWALCYHVIRQLPEKRSQSTPDTAATSARRT